MSTDDKSTSQEAEGKMPVDNPELEHTAKEEERTLTDHLNKKLLASFLSRIDAGTTGFTNLPRPLPKEEEENPDFD